MADYQPVSPSSALTYQLMIEYTTPGEGFAELAGQRACDAESDAERLYWIDPEETK